MANHPIERYSGKTVATIERDTVRGWERMKIRFTDGSTLDVVAEMDGNHDTLLGLGGKINEPSGEDLVFDTLTDDALEEEDRRARNAARAEEDRRSLDFDQSMNG